MIVLGFIGAGIGAGKGKPLYTFASDTKPGDVKGQGVNGFHAVLSNGTKY